MTSPNNDSEDGGENPLYEPYEANKTSKDSVGSVGAD